MESMTSKATSRVKEILKIIKQADDLKRSKLDLSGAGMRINWDYLIEAVEELEHPNLLQKEGKK
jgi:hypothetical protein